MSVKIYGIVKYTRVQNLSENQASQMWTTVDAIDMASETSDKDIAR